jgi:hypothetical protein
MLPLLELVLVSQELYSWLESKKPKVHSKLLKLKLNSLKLKLISDIKILLNNKEIFVLLKLMI